MPTSYLPYQPTQDLLLPPSLRDWLPQDHLAHYISDTIDALDLSAFYRRYEGGRPRVQSHTRATSSTRMALPRMPQ
jgi:hypothetical protein